MNIYYRYGMAKEKTLFEKNKNLYSGLVLPAHIAIDQSESLPGWLATNKIDYFIDPITFIFNEKTAKLYNKKNNLRRSYKKYIDMVNLGHISFEQDEFLTLSHFKTNDIIDDEKINNFADKFFRTQAIMKELDDETKELINFFKEKNIAYPLKDILDKGHNPLFYTSPGFFFNSPKNDWFSINVKLMEKTINLSGNKKIYGYLLIGKTVFKQKFIESIVNELPEGLKGLVVWFEGFNEITATKDELRFVALTIQKLSQRGYNVINLYSGPFSMLLSDIGCSGFSSGLLYDMSRTRAIEPIGGPIPFRYYIPEIDKFVGQTDAESYYRLFPSSLCGCEICKSKLTSLKKKEEPPNIHLFFDYLFKYDSKIDGDYVNHENMLKQHFMYSMKSQQQKIKKEGIKNVLDEKEIIYKTMVERSSSSIANKYASHIPRWKKVLSEFI